MTEQHRLTQVMAMPVCAEVDRIVQELTRVQHNSGEQNQDITEYRLARDWRDILMLSSRFLLTGILLLLIVAFRIFQLVCMHIVVSM